MSLAFLTEAGIHGPIEPGLAMSEVTKQMADCSGMYTSDGILHVSFSYSHQTGSVIPKLTSESALGTTPVHFYDSLPASSPALLRQLHLLEWNGFFKPLQATLDEVATIDGGDRRLLWSSLHSAHIEVRVPSVLVARAAKSTRLIVWLATWLFTFRDLVQDPVGDPGDDISFRLSVYDEQGEPMSIITTGASSVQVSAKLFGGILKARGLNSQLALKVAIGDTIALRIWCQYESREDPELALLNC